MVSVYKWKDDKYECCSARPSCLLCVIWRLTNCMVEYELLIKKMVMHQLNMESGKSSVDFEMVEEGAWARCCCEAGVSKGRGGCMGKVLL